MFSARRLPGPNLYSTHPGAVLEVLIEPAEATARLAAWRACVRLVLDRLGWDTEHVAVREWPLGAGLFISCPLDGLLAGTEVLEQAWAFSEPSSGPEDDAAGFEDALARLRVHVQHERHRRLVALARAAADRGFAFTFDDDAVAVGSGSGVATWPFHALPDAGLVDWARVHDVPVALVTGSNGKTTTVRLLAAMLRAAGHTSGHTCTSGVYVGTTRVEEGDWSGPAGARRILQDARVTAAVLETARGGILRRGLATTVADVAVVTRIAADHFGEYGIHDIMGLAEAKLVVARPLRAGAPLVLNADDPVLVACVERGLVPHQGPITWTSLDGDSPVVARHLAQGGHACLFADGTIAMHRGSGRIPVIAVADVPITLGGAARHNIANAVAATAAAFGLGLPLEAIRAALASFGTAVTDNPGRLHVFAWRGATVVVDFVHNPDGWRAILEALAPRRTGRLIVTLGQAGDRDDDAMRALASAVVAGRPDVVVLKEMPHYLRGREPGEAVHVLEDALHALGVPATALRHADGDAAAARVALAEAAPGDLVILATHDAYDDVMGLLAGAVPPAA